MLAATTLVLLASGCVGGRPQAPQREPRGPVTAAPAPSIPREAALVSVAYRSWARDRAAATARHARRLVDAVHARDLPAARQAYAAVLLGYEAMRPAGEAFPDADRAIAATREEAGGDDWRGLRPLEAALYGHAPWERRATLARQLAADLEELGEQLDGLSLDGRAQVRAASHLLSDIEAYDLGGRSEPRSGLALDVAAARLDGAAALWDAVAPAVRAARPAAGQAVERELARRRATLDGADPARDRWPGLGQQVDRAANAIAATAGVFG